MKNWFIKSAFPFTLSVFVCLLAIRHNALAANRPNVILIMTDDQGYGDLSCHGNPTLKTPNLDTLHSESIRFTDFHVSPFCTPTRAALMTGRYAGRTGAYRTSSGRTSIHPREKTLGDLFTTNGYATGMFGKWHLGDNAPSRPMDCGFEKSVWHRCGGVTQISDYWTNDYFDDTYLAGDRWKKFEGYCTDVWFDQAMNFISGVLDDAGGEKPFFVYLPTNAPHGPYLVAGKWKRPYLDMGLPKTQAAFKGMVANFDWNLGRLRDFLRRERLDDDTLLIYMTDNGTSAGTVFGKGGRITGWPKDPRENAGMRAGKSSPYDGGHRVPLFMHWPAGKLGAPCDIETLAMHCDIMPTLAELCDLKRPASWPPLDGRSLAPLIHNAKTEWEPRALHTQIHGGNGFREPEHPWLIGVAMTEKWRLVEGRELYDITKDPTQKNDVADKFPDVVRTLNDDHLKWINSIRPGMIPTRILLGSDFENPSYLTSQEWVMPKGGPPWAKAHVMKRMIANAPWWVEIAKPGNYRFTLSRWTLTHPQPIDSTAATISVGGQTKTKTINEPNKDNSVTFDLNLKAGPTELLTELTTPEGKKHGAYFVRVERVDPDQSKSRSTQLLWTQYCTSVAADGNTIKLSVHTDADPSQPTDAKVELSLMRSGRWQPVAEATIDSLTAMAEFRLDEWDANQTVRYRVQSGNSNLEGKIRANPKDSDVLKLMAVACVNDKWFPYTEAVTQMIEQDPDIVFFAGDQIYESNAGGEVIMANESRDVPAAMANYLAKWRKFGLTFRDLLKDRPSIMITDDHDVYANDLWGNGGRRMKGTRTSGGYIMHPDWVNAAERTQTWHLPDPIEPGPHGDGIFAYYSSLDYGGVSFAILEDRKFKSPPTEVLNQAIDDPESKRPNRTLEVIKDPAFDAAKLDRPDLQLLGKSQEAFVKKWAADALKRKRLAAVLSQSPFVNIGNYEVRFGDMDSNGWPQSARNRALSAMQAARPVMISGDIHFGTLHQHGIERWGDGPWGFSVPAFASKPNRVWGPREKARGREIPGIAGSGNYVDRFQNKLTVAATAPGINGYGMIRFEKPKNRIVCELHTMDAERTPDGKNVPGWPLVIEVPFDE